MFDLIPGRASTTPARALRLERAVRLAARQTALASLAAQEYPGAEEARAAVDAELAALRDEADRAGDWPEEVAG